MTDISGSPAFIFTYLLRSRWRIRPWYDDANCFCSVLAFGLGSMMSIRVALRCRLSLERIMLPTAWNPQLSGVFIIVSIVSAINRFFYGLREWPRANLTSRTWWFDFGVAFSYMGLHEEAERAPSARFDISFPSQAVLQWPKVLNQSTAAAVLAQSYRPQRTSV